MTIQAAGICIQFAARSTELATLALVALLSASAHAGETWDGGGADNNWTTDANWNANCPICLDSIPDNDGTADIRMAGTTRLTPRVDVDWDIDSLTFNNTAGAFSISGNAGVSLGIGAGGITNNDAQLQLLLLPIGLNASQTWNAAAGPLSIGNTVAGHPLLTRTLTLDGANNIQIAGAITNGAALNKTGAGTLTFNGLNTNSYTGTTTVSAGTLALGRTGGPNRSIPRNLVIGDGAGGVGADVVRLDAGDQITEAAGRTVTVNNSGLLNLNGFNETLANLAINGGSVSGVGSLVVNEALTFTGGGSISGTSITAATSSTVVDGGTVNASSGGQVSNLSSRIGATAGPDATVSVSGAGSTWTNSQSLYVGDAANGTLNISGGALVTSANGYIGNQANSTSIVTVDGAGSTWTNSGILYAGYAGNGTLNMTNGGKVVASGGIIAREVGSVGETTIDGAGSSWLVDNVLVVGYYGVASLNMRNGGKVSSFKGAKVGYWSGSTGSVLLDGAGSEWTCVTTAGDFHVGFQGVGSIEITNGALLNTNTGSGQVTIGNEVGSNGAVLVDNASWNHRDDSNNPGFPQFRIGGGGVGTLTIINGGYVGSYLSSIGIYGTVTIDGANSRWVKPTAPGPGFDDLNINGGTLIVRNGGRVIRPTSEIISSGTITGDGYIDAIVENHALVAPGNPVGALHLERRYSQASTGTLSIELASTTNYDQLIISSLSTLDGTLTVNLLNGFIPAVGQTFTILTANDVDGTFATELLPSVNNLTFDVMYNAQSVVLKAIPALPGDYDLSGTVNAADYVVWRKGLGTIFTPTDYDVWRAHFGTSFGVGSSSVLPSAESVPATVPEPATFVLLILAADTCLKRRRNTAFVS